MFELTLLDAELLGDSDVRLTQALDALQRHLEAKQDLETARLVVPILNEILQQSEILNDVYRRASEK